LCSLGAQTSDRCRAIVRSWLEILAIADLNAMAWAALPIIFGNQFLKDHHNMLDKIVKAVEIRNRKNAVIAQLNAILSYPPPEKVAPDIDTPTLIISGSEDVLVEPNDVRQLARLCKARHARLAGIGHSIPAEAPQVFQKTVLEFFNESV
jgi:pimeloyl-ACP methyl ester carboxylesterase